MYSHNMVVSPSLLYVSSKKPVLSLRICLQPHLSHFPVCHEACGTQCQHVNRNVIHLVAAPLVMLSIPATSGQANKVSNMGTHAREEKE